MEAPTKKIVPVLIVCIGVVVSVFLFSKTGNLQTSINTGSATSTSVNIPKLYDSGDWQKILSSVDTGTTTILTNQKTNTYEGEGTETDQMAKDFLAQYLSLKQGGATITDDQINAIVENILSSPEYTKATGVEYTANDLHITSQTDKETVRKYMSDGSNILTKNSNKGYGDVLAILEEAINSNDESVLAKLDPIITNYKNIISGSLNLSVPKDAVSVHLAMLNAVSNVLSNIEAMRVTFSDPVKSFAGMSQYKLHMVDFETAMNNLGTYFSAKGVL